MSETAPVETAILQKLVSAFPGDEVHVLNESHGHNVPANSETHFRVLVVSSRFEGVLRVQRHRQINALLADELAGPVHALAIEAFTPAQWEKKQGPTPAPACHGGSKRDPLFKA